MQQILLSRGVSMRNIAARLLWYQENMTSSTKWKYTILCNTSGGEPSHRQYAMKIWCSLDILFLRYVHIQTVQTDMLITILHMATMWGRVSNE